MNNSSELQTAELQTAEPQLAETILGAINQMGFYFSGTDATVRHPNMVLTANNGARFCLAFIMGKKGQCAAALQDESNLVAVGRGSNMDAALFALMNSLTYTGKDTYFHSIGRIGLYAGTAYLANKNPYLT